MRVVGNLNSRVLVRLTPEENLPSATLNVATLLQLLVGEFGFSNQPQPNRPAMVNFGPGGSVALPVSAGPLILTGGTIKLGEKKIDVNQIQVAPELGQIMVVSDTTENADFFLDQLFTVLQGQLLYRSLVDVQRVYASGLVVEFPSKFEDYFNRLSDILGLVSKAFVSEIGIDHTVGLERISFAVDPMQLPAVQSQFVGAFIIERRADVTYAKNRFFTSAPFKTRSHLQLLEKIAGLLEGA